jgi:hypothetical protein
MYQVMTLVSRGQWNIAYRGSSMGEADAIYWEMVAQGVPVQYVVKGRIIARSASPKLTGIPC